MSETNRVSLRYVPETTYNTTPANSTSWKTVRFTGEGLIPNYGTKQSEEIRSDRMRSDVILTSATVSGPINFEFSPGTLDDFFQAVLGGTWTTNVLKVGTVKRSFSIEKVFNDLASGNKYDLYTGMRANELKLSFKYGDIATGSCTFNGAGATDSATSAVGTGTVAAATTTQPFDGTFDVSSVTVDGAPAGLYFKSLDLTLQANLRDKTAIGTPFPYDQGYGSAGVEVAASAYFDSRVLESKVRSGAPFALAFTVSDGTNSYQFSLPRAFSTQRNGLAASKLNDDVMQDLTISAAYDSVSGSSIVITRAP